MFQAYMRWRICAALFLLLLTLVGCTGGVPNPPTATPTMPPAAAATRTESPSPTPSVRPAETPVIPTDWQRFSDPDWGYAFHFPSWWVECTATQNSHLFCDPGDAANGPVPPAFYMTVMPSGFINEQAEAYNFMPDALVHQATMLGVGESLALPESNPDFFTYTRLPDSRVAGEVGIVIENEHVWEAPLGVHERRVLVVRDEVTYLLGSYYATPADLAVFETVLATVEFGSKGTQATTVTSPDGRWSAFIDAETGALTLRGVAENSREIFPIGSTVQAVLWSPDSRGLVAVRANWTWDEPDAKVESGAPPEIWWLPLQGEKIGEPYLRYRADTALFGGSYQSGPTQIVLGDWSPNARYLLFWYGPLGASIMADGLQPWVLNIESGAAYQPADSALLNPRYHSWSPDSSTLAITAGSGRSAQVNKWLNLYDTDTGEVVTVISETEQVPGIVAWSPEGDRIAYAAVRAEETGQEWANLMTWENPAISGRRIYLLDPKTGEHRRLNATNAFQDAPVWSENGAVLYYVQKEGAQLVLVSAAPNTGQAQIVEGSQQPIPEKIGYYGQGDWLSMLKFLPGGDRLR